MERLLGNYPVTKESGPTPIPEHPLAMKGKCPRMGEPLAVWRHGAVTDRRTMVNLACLCRLFRARVLQHPQRQPDQDRSGSRFFGMPSPLLTYPGLLRQELGHAGLREDQVRDRHLPPE